MLIPALRSTNYVPGVTGWTINADGTVDIMGLTVNGPAIVDSLHSSDYVVGVSGWILHDTGGAEFNDLTVRGPIVADAIWSTGFDASDSEIDGWRLGDDGTAQFSNVEIGSDSYTISSDGVASFSTVNTANLTVGGEPIGAILDRSQRTISSWRMVGSSAVLPTAAEVEVWQVGVAAARLVPGWYRLHASGMRFVNATAVDWLVRYRFGALAIGSSTVLSIYHLKNPAPGAYASFTESALLYCDGTQDLFLRASAYVHGGASVQFVSADNAMWMLEYLGNSAEVVPSTLTLGGGGGAPPPETTVVSEWAATAVRSYRGDGSFRADTGDAVQGYSGSNGNGKAAVQWPWAAIASTLAGRTVDKVEVYLYYSHWYAFSGGQAVVGWHNTPDIGAAGSWAGIVTPTSYAVGPFPWARNEGKWIEVPSTTGDGLRDGWLKGLTVGPGPTTSTLYYGRADGIAGNSPRIRITHTG